MPSDIETKAFDKSLIKVTSRWHSKLKQPMRDLEKVHKALAALAKQKELSAEDEKLQAKLKKAAAKLQKAVEKATKEYELEVLLLTPPPEAPKSALEKRFKPILEKYKKGLPLARGWTLIPKIDVDVKKRKFKKFELRLKWEF